MFGFSGFDFAVCVVGVQDAVHIASLVIREEWTDSASDADRHQG